ncbi:MAG: polyamine aminopropyltransferase [Symbiobacteriaceae bacterium]|nr:polyamine aminopropyltransferase [Symbiobacteriaceae bacterium]
MTQWFYEEQTQHTRLGIQVRRLVHQAKSPYQEIKVFETMEYGMMLSLDDVIQLTELDEFVYHEMLAHVPLHAHPAPRDVLIVGGGDGGMVREASKHLTVQRVVLAEIDEAVIQASINFIPSVSCALTNNPKLDLRIGDAIHLVQQANEEFDVIIVDSSDPVGPAEKLFTFDFYKAVYRALKPGGMVTIQGESPWMHRALIKKVNSDLHNIFPIATTYWGNIPTYPGGTMVFPIGSKGVDPRTPMRTALHGLKYYSADVHRAAFSLPYHLTPEHMEVSPTAKLWEG